MATVVKCEGEAFRGLRNLYTGEPVEVEMALSGGRAVFRAAKRTYATSDEFPTYQEARAMWSRVDGVVGAKPASAPVVCAYTGRPLVPVKTASGGFRFAGGFDPNMWAPRDAFLAAMRGRPREAPVRAEPVRRPPERRRRASAPVHTGEGVEIVKAAAEAAGVKVSSGAVSMSVPGKGRRR